MEVNILEYRRLNIVFWLFLSCSFREHFVAILEIRKIKEMRGGIIIIIFY